MKQFKFPFVPVRRAAGVDGESLEAFEKDLKGGLYKIWNRMSSGSYFPPPVRLIRHTQRRGPRPMKPKETESYPGFFKRLGLKLL